MLGNQYTHTEWSHSNLDHFHNADQSRHEAQRIRAEASLLITERGAKTVQESDELNNCFDSNFILFTKVLSLILLKNSLWMKLSRIIKRKYLV